MLRCVFEFINHNTCQYIQTATFWGISQKNNSVLMEDDEEEDTLLAFKVAVK